MNKHLDFIEQARQVLTTEMQAIQVAADRIDGQFSQAIETILTMKGRLILTGMGKPGYIARKIAATLMSTGTPAYYLHPAEGSHGDLGMITPHDVVIALSNSGETPEIINILPAIHRIGAHIIALCGNTHSTLAQYSDITLDASVDKEACPLDLAPTSSTTVALALGDALAVVLMQSRQFTANDFALFHPGGALGRKLLLTVEHVMHSGEQNPLVTPENSIADALFVMTDKGFGATSVIDSAGKLIGLITDGDIRRHLAHDTQILHQPVASIMTRNPLAVHRDKLAAEAISLMENHQPKPITVLPVINDESEVVGILHITDLMKGFL
ncbi:arabinose-5-phosphate isomerase [Pragia fontium]|uniref:Arabinose 5-phosphate isomerase n=1 Tax=Pragia fontium TaxID=82985 RepID=A0ABQ5LK90_9GAMM|nr:KpsF/GutQ family sugar-phosphate isomerase [Pragia fontium]GKX64036.1 arabinose-5-phosphate isomerase [Pragia fontium]